ncbi:hypothetical protein FHS43_005989 [Streptosporangium becharense]|uniref:STAS domain-containing protein n=1 Tax=Streptosporangium becharense TaxID=1816182 RepID=A0A7W9IHL1_9ACTN|nr:STAS domain-containing protein [Streptosporangium becharense]MBB2914677.1 hypothetical protein [Streptosporangium becharense]MBB5820922.1 hypothetical protein [Streptosporangium becharense]
MTTGTLKRSIVDLGAVTVSNTPETGSCESSSDSSVTGAPPPGCGAGGLWIVPLVTPAGLKVSGEIDRTTRGMWERALDGLVTGGGDLHLDLSELTFIDVRGTWLLTRAAQNLPPGDRVFLHRSPYCLRSVLTLIGSDPSPIEVETA